MVSVQIPPARQDSFRACSQVGFKFRRACLRTSKPSRKCDGFDVSGGMVGQERLWEIAVDQHGYVTAAQAYEQGLSQPAVAMLMAFLDFQRATLAVKCEGLSEEQLRRRSVAPSTLSLLGLVRHAGDVERRRWIPQLGEQGGERVRCPRGPWPGRRSPRPFVPSRRRGSPSGYGWSPTIRPILAGAASATPTGQMAASSAPQARAVRTRPMVEATERRAILRMLVGIQHACGRDAY